MTTKDERIEGLWREAARPLVARPLWFHEPFAPSSIRAILEGRQTVLRRPVLPLPKGDFVGCGLAPRAQGGYVETFGWNNDQTYRDACVFMTCPYGAPGDRLWVQEEFRLVAWHDGRTPQEALEHQEAHNGALPDVEYRTVRKPLPIGEQPGKWRPAKEMPRWASRIELEVLSVRVERLQDITESEAVAEGIGSSVTRECKVPQFADLWNCIYEDENSLTSWDANPWVWRIAFRRTKP